MNQLKTVYKLHMKDKQCVRDRTHIMKNVIMCKFKQIKWNWEIIGIDVCKMKEEFVA